MTQRTLEDIAFDLSLALSDYADIVTAEVREALGPFITDWNDAGVPADVNDDLLMSEVDFGNSKLTVGDWRRLITAARNLADQP